VLGRNVAPLVFAEVGDIDQIQRGRIGELLHGCQAPVVALRHPDEPARSRVVAVNPFGEESVNGDGIKPQSRRRRQVSVRAINAPGGPHHARKLFERERFPAVLAP